MAENLKWIFELIDKMSGPAKGISKALQGVSDALAVGRKKSGIERILDSMPENSRRFGIAAWNGIGKVWGGKLQTVLGKGATALTDVDDALGAVGMSLGGVVKTGAMTAVTAIAAVGAAAVAAGVKLASMAVEYGTAGAKFVLESGSFRENSLLGLEAMLKSKTEAQKVYANALRIASATPFETQDIVGMSQQLIGYGFKSSELDRVITAVGDMAAAKGMDKGIAQRLGLAMGQIRAKGKLQGDELMQLMEAGVNAGDIYAKIGAMMGGKTTDEVRKLQAAGKISSDVAIEAIIQTVQSTYGGTMDKLSGSLTGLLSTLKSRPFEFVNAAIAGKGGTSSFFEEIKNGVKTVSDLFGTKMVGDQLLPSTETGQKAVSIMDQLSSAFAQILPTSTEIEGAIKYVLEAVEQVLPDIKTLISEVGAAIRSALPSGEGQNGLAAFFKAIIGFARMAIPFVEGLFSGFKSALGPILSVMGAFSGGDMNVTAAILRSIGETVGWLIGMFVNLGAVLLGAAAAMAAPFILLFKAIGWAWDIGKKIVLGLAEGIKGAGSAVFDALGSLLSGAVDWVERLLLIRSPSKVFAGLGEMTMAGYVKGLEAVDVNAGFQQSLALPAPGFASGMLQGGSQVNVSTLQVSAPVHVAGGDAETKEAAERAVERLLPSALADALEQFAQEMALA